LSHRSCVTVRLRPGERFQLVFHRGAKVRRDSDELTFNVGDGLLNWASADRVTLTLHDMDEVRTRLPAQNVTTPDAPTA
jgi:hypothetical protein